MTPAIISLMMGNVPELLKIFVSIVVPIAGKLLEFTRPRLARIPLYLRLLWTIYQDKELDAEARKYLTSLLLLLSSILTFMAYSYVPWTGLPILGIFMTPIAAILALVIILVGLDAILGLNRNYLCRKYPEEFSLVNADIHSIAELMGQSWDATVNQIQALLDQIKKSIDPNSNYDDTILTLINGLIHYLNDPKSDTSLSTEQINHRIVTEGLPPMAKIAGSVLEGMVGGAIAGGAVHGAASHMFVQAGLLTSIKAALGVGTGIAVAAPTYGALVFAAPIGLSILTGAGIVHGAMALRDQGEKKKLSAFLGDVIVASLSMAWVDDQLSAGEQEVLEKLLLNPAINQQDTQRIREAMASHKSFEEILQMGLLKESDPQKARMKHCLVLCTSWELAKADGAISLEELDLHNRMAKFMNIQEEEVHEIRRLVLLKSGINLHDRFKVIQGDITQQSVDAIVNSTNANLRHSNKLSWLPGMKPSNRVDEAIHRAAGAALQKECQTVQPCGVGEVKLTSGYQLPSRWVLHTVVPNMKEPAQAQNASALLAACYRNSLQLAHAKNWRTIAFPALATGMGGMAVEETAAIAVAEITAFLNTHFSVEQVYVVCSDSAICETYTAAAERCIGESTQYLNPAADSLRMLPADQLQQV